MTEPDYGPDMHDGIRLTQIIATTLLVVLTFAAGFLGGMIVQGIR